jgi:phage shock protein A
MEDTLVEIKASCAGVMAGSKKLQRQIEGIRLRESYWEEKASLAVNKGRDDLAREALVERRGCLEREEALERELMEHNALIKQYQEDIRQLEEKLVTAREKQRMLVQRHIYANRKKQPHDEIRPMENTEAIFRFEELENRIERMEAEADLVNFGRKPPLEEELDDLGVDEEIEQELRALKSSVSGKDESAREV